MSPVAREVVGRTRHKATLSPGVVTRDIRGNAAPNGQYLTPVGIEYPGMEGIDLGRIQTPFSFSGVPWNLDRRLSPGGCIGPCEGTPQPLSPFPFEGIDPRTQSLLAPVPDPEPDPVVLPVRAVRRPGVAAGRPRVDRRHPRRAPGVGLRPRGGPAAGHRRSRRNVPGRAGDDRRPGQRRLRVQPRQRGVRDDRDRAAPRDGGPRPRHRRGALHPGPRLRGPGCLHLHLHGPCGGGVQRRHGGRHRQPDVRRAGGRER